MTLEIRNSCGGCGSEPDWGAKANTYSYKCAFCRDCLDGMNHIYLNCGGEPPRPSKRIQCRGV